VTVGTSAGLKSGAVGSVAIVVGSSGTVEFDSDIAGKRSLGDSVFGLAVPS
jgi:hypothetical protein